MRKLKYKFYVWSALGRFPAKVGPGTVTNRSGLKMLHKSTKIKPGDRYSAHFVSILCSNRKNYNLKSFRRSSPERLGDEYRKKCWRTMAGPPRASFVC